MGNNNKAQIIGVTGQKGGTGKSTVAQTIIGYAHYVLGLNCLAVDLDSQASWYMERLSDIEVHPEDVNNPYDILSLTSNDFFETYEGLLGEYDLIVVDFPGSLDQENIMEAHFIPDMLLVPFSTHKKEILACTNFIISFYIDKVQPNLSLIGNENQQIYGVMNKVNKNLKSYKETLEDVESDKLKSRYGIEFFEQPITYADGVFGQYNTTITPVMSANGELMYEDLIKEILSKVLKVK